MISPFSIENMKEELARALNKAAEDAKTIQSLRNEIESYKLTLRANGVAPTMLLDQAG